MSALKGAGDKVVVVGAGIGGLTCALLLTARGFDVTVLEKRADTGGKLRQVEAAGLAVDSGPTVVTLLPIFERLFSMVGESFGDFVRLKPADILARHQWRDGSRLDLFADPARTEDAIGAFAGAAEARGYRAFCRHASDVFATLDKSFMDEAEPSLGGLVIGAGLRGLPALTRIGAFTTLWSVTGQYFADARLRQLFGRYATYCGSSPFEAPGPLALVAHAEQAGVWLAEDGMMSIRDAFLRLARARGATIRTGCEVREILIEDGGVSGVRTDDGADITADMVVFNGDPSAIAAGLLGTAAMAAVSAWQPRQRSLSALTLSLTARASGFPLLRHSVFFSADYEKEFAEIFRKRRLPDDPTVYVCAQDRLAGDGSRALERERLFMIINAPPDGDRGSPSEEEVRRCTERAMARLDAAGLDLEIEDGGLITTTPKDFERLFPGTGGALYGRASHGWAASFQRPTARTRLPGLYLAGGATHPGPGLPMAALSGLHAVTTLIRDRDSTSMYRRAVTPGGTSTP